ncbi:gag-pol protein [Lasius niger]|uniref:Gag-pol protein n=1 Tax=Lasius niger TaxID=67767 RepID=A0A0J7K282_LASNI|nr:gag-pol protein [Lasius niger]
MKVRERIQAIEMPVLVTTQELAEGQHDDKELQMILASDSFSLQLRKLRIDNTNAVVYCDISGDDVRPWPEAIHIRDTTAKIIVSAFYASWMARFGAPAIITTDRATQFESKLFEALTKLIGSHRTRTTAYYPASNGMIERWHRSLKAIMCHGTLNWTAILPTVLLGLRTSYKEDIRSSAAEMVYGTTIRLPGEFFVDAEPNNNPQAFKEELREHMQSVRPTPTAHHDRKRTFTHTTLHT